MIDQLRDAWVAAQYAKMQALDALDEADSGEAAGCYQAFVIASDAARLAWKQYRKEQAA